MDQFTTTVVSKKKKKTPFNISKAAPTVLRAPMSKHLLTVKNFIISARDLLKEQAQRGAPICHNQFGDEGNRGEHREITNSSHVNNDLESHLFPRITQGDGI